MNEIDYAELVQSYNDSLNTRLRGFRPAASFLESWVPDLNHSKSLLNLVEAAELGDVAEIAVLLEPAVARDIDRAELISLLKSLADVGFEETPAHLKINLKLKSISGTGAVSNRDYLSPYRAGISEWAAQEHPSFEKPLPKLSPKETAVTASASAADGSTLSAIIDPKNDNVIQHAVYSGIKAPETKLLMDIVCAAIEGLPIQEAADHAMIRVEYRLRRSGVGEAPIKGIITPRNADPMFALPLQLIRAIHRDYKKQQHIQEKINFFDRAPSDQWLALNVDQKMKRIADFVATKFAGSIPAGQILHTRRLDGEGDFRVFFAWEGDSGSAEKAAVLMKLERRLRDEVEERLEIFMEEWKDQNSKRRL